MASGRAFLGGATPFMTVGFGLDFVGDFANQFPGSVGLFLLLWSFNFSCVHISTWLFFLFPHTHLDYGKGVVEDVVDSLKWLTFSY
jgi:hypothetical protein